MLKRVNLLSPLLRHGLRYSQRFCSNQDNLDDKKEELSELRNEASSVLARISTGLEMQTLKSTTSDFFQQKSYQRENVEYIISQCDLIQEVLQDKETAAESNEFIETELGSIRKKIDALGITPYLDLEEDTGDAIVHFTSGPGGDDSNDWTGMLKRMYEQWGEKNALEVNEIEISEATHGIKSATVQICGENVFGLLKRETGVHRLIRISPFNAQGKRQTSFASVTVVPSLNDDISIQIRPSEIRVETKRASGPGGQHVNTTDSAVRITHIPTGITANASTKSQSQNKKLALAVLKSRLYEHELKSKGNSSVELKSSIDQQSWGSQIRNYVLHPYQTVVDLRTRVTMQPQSVLDGSKLGDLLYQNIKLLGPDNKVQCL